MKSKFFFGLATVTIICALLLSAAPAWAQASAFTYQGQLKTSGAPATGTYDFEFRLFDAAAAGNQLGAVSAQNNVAVANGVFTVMLDFGAQFTGAARWLDISVRAASGGAFIVLNPRQPLTATPYAVRSASAGQADNATNAGNATTATNATNATTAQNALQLGGVAASQFVITSDPRLSDARPPTAGSANYIQNTTSLQPLSNFNISGTGAANIFNAAQYNLGGARILSYVAQRSLAIGAFAGAANDSPGTDNTFVGHYAGQFNTNGERNSFFGAGAGRNIAIGEQNSFFGYAAGLSNTTGKDNTAVGANADVGAGNLFNATAIGFQAFVAQSNSLVLGSIAGVNNATTSTNVGIGTTTPEARLQVRGGAILIDNNQGFFLKDTNGTNKRGLLADTNNILHIGSGGNIGFDEMRFDLAVGGTVMTITAGTVGIGTTVTDQKLSVNGNASKVGGGSWAVFSDERLKNIHGHYTRGLSTLMQLQPIRYEYKADNALGLRGEGEYIGFSAQEVQRVLPEAVRRTGSGYLQLNNDPILWTMLNAVKEQQAQIESLRAEKTALAERLAAVEAALQRLAEAQHNR